MKVPYLQGKAKVPQPSLRGGLVRYRPITAVRISGPAGNQVLDGLLDSGADDSILPEWVAAMVGIDLDQAINHEIILAGRQKPIRCRYSSTKIRITDGKHETYEWDAMIGFVAAPLKYALLGQAGVLEYFDITFQGADHVATLLPNWSFTGT